MFWLHTARNEDQVQDTPQTHPSTYGFHECHSDTSRHPKISHRHPPDIPQKPQTSPRNTTCQQTTRDANRHRRTYFQCLAVLGGVCWHVMFPGEALGVSGGCLGGVWRYLSVTHGIRWRLKVVGGYLGPHCLQYGAKTLFWHIPKRHDSLSPDHTKTLRYQNGRM